MFSKRPFLIYPLIITTLFFAITLPLLSLPGIGNDDDERMYHYPSILLIRSHWPRLDFIGDVLSGVSPGYTYFLATVSLITGSGLVTMRAVNDVISLLVLLVLFYWLSRWVSPRRAFGLVLPLALSANFLKASCRVVTDNGALLLIVCTLASVFLMPSRGWPGALGGLYATIATFFRQVSIWLEAPLFLQPIVEFWDESWSTGKFSIPRISPSEIGAGLVRLLPMAYILFLFHVWHGAAPPIWQSTMVGGSFAPMAFVLSLAAFLGTPMLFALGALLPSKLIFSRAILWAALVGLLVACPSPTSWSYEHGRWGGAIWSLVHRTPVIADRSLFFMVTSPFGAVVIFLFFRLIAQNATSSRAFLWLGSVIGWMTAYFPSACIYQRYFEDQLLVFLIVAVALIISPHRSWSPRLFPLILLACYLIGTILIEIYLPAFMGAHAIQSLRAIEMKT